MQEKEKVKLLKLTDEQKALLPAMINSFLLVNPQNEQIQQNLQLLINQFDERTQIMVYRLIKNDLTARIQRQITTLKAELERM